LSKENFGQIEFNILYFSKEQFMGQVVLRNRRGSEALLYNLGREYLRGQIGVGYFICLFWWHWGLISGPHAC
jgi:hypothetical protein